MSGGSNSINVEDMDGVGLQRFSTTLSVPSGSYSYDGDSVLIATKSPPAVVVSNEATNAPTVHKLKEANIKYKNLLKLAKERIQAQEDELELLRASSSASSSSARAGSLSSHRTDNAVTLSAALSIPLLATERSTGLVSSLIEILTLDYDAYPPLNTGDENNNNNTLTCAVVRVCQRIKLEESHTRLVDYDEPWDSVLWALIEYEFTLPDGVDVTNYFTHILQTLKQHTSQSFRFQRWKRFKSNESFLDHIRRDHGEPIQIPHFSFTPQQAAQLTAETKKHVEAITEDFRKFRVKAEIARKQAEDTIHILQRNQTQERFTAVTSAAAAATTTATTTTTSPTETETETEASITINQLQRLQKEIIQQDIQWKKHYEELMTENNKLKSNASEGLIASQWRHRYEQVCKDRDDWKSKCEVLTMSSSSPIPMNTYSPEHNTSHTTSIGRNGRNSQGENNYESKYRDLKESFRLYRKKAKEIFDAQQRGDATDMMIPRSLPPGKSSEDAKMVYLKNLMVNYLSADESSDLRGPMERAIGTVLQFSDNDYIRISNKKTSMTGSNHGSFSWFS